MLRTCSDCESGVPRWRLGRTRKPAQLALSGDRRRGRCNLPYARREAVGRDVNSLALLIYNASRLAEAEPLMRRALRRSVALIARAAICAAVRLGAFRPCGQGGAVNQRWSHIESSGLSDSAVMMARRQLIGAADRTRDLRPARWGRQASTWRLYVQPNRRRREEEEDDGRRELGAGRCRGIRLQRCDRGLQIRCRTCTP